MINPNKSIVIVDILVHYEHALRYTKGVCEHVTHRDKGGN